MAQRPFVITGLLLAVLFGPACTEVDEEECVFTKGVESSPAARDPLPIAPEYRGKVSPEVRDYIQQRHDELTIVATTTTKYGTVWR
jgi:hypothetical protein